MKKIRFILCALAALAFASCQQVSIQENTEQNEETPAINYVFNITVANPDGADTKSVKAGWEEGDVIGLWMDNAEDCPAQVSLTFDGQNWTCTTTPGVILNNSEGHLSALYKGDNDLDLSSSIVPLVLSCEGVEYTTSETNPGSIEVTATLNDWVYETPIQIVVPGIEDNFGDYTLSCEDLVAGDGIIYSIDSNNNYAQFSIANAALGNATTGVENTSTNANNNGGAAFYFTESNASSAQAFTFVLSYNGKSYTYTSKPTTIYADGTTVKRVNKKLPAIGDSKWVESTTNYVARFSINGIVDEANNQELAAGAIVTFPESIVAPEGKVFVGWAKQAITGTTDAAPAMVEAGNEVMAADNTTYYAIFATENVIPGDFSKYEAVTSEPSDWSGTYIMVIGNAVVEIDGNKTASMKHSTSFVPTTENAGAEIRVERTSATENKYSILLSSGKYLGKSTSTTSFAMGNYSENTYDWAISTESITSISAPTRCIMANGDNVGTYVPQSSYSYAVLYKRVNATGETTYSDYCTFIQRLVLITVSGEPNKTEYVEGELFNPSGLIVTGTYNDNTQSIITDGVDWIINPSTGLAYGTVSVSIKAKVGDIESESFSITGLIVEKASEITVTWVAANAVDNPGNDKEWYSSAIDTNISWSATDGTNPPKYFTSGSGLRIYNGGTFTVSAANNKKITKVVLTFSGTSYTFSTSNTTTPYTETLSSVSSKTWSVSRTCRLQKVEVTYTY